MQLCGLQYYVDVALCGDTLIFHYKLSGGASDVGLRVATDYGK